MNREPIIDKILREQSLTEEERSWWNDNKDNVDVKEEFQFLKELINPLLIENKNLLKDQLKSFEKGSNRNTATIEPKKGRVVRLKPWMGIAAALIVLIASVTLLRSNQGDSYFDKFFEPYPSIVNPVVKGVQDETSNMDKIMQSYENENYQFVIDEVGALTTTNDTLSFYLGNALLSKGQAVAALPLFVDLQISDNRFSKEAAWFEALSHLRLERLSQARSKLEEINKDESHPYHEEAQDLLRKIK